MSWTQPHLSIWTPLGFSEQNTCSFQQIWRVLRSVLIPVSQTWAFSTEPLSNRSVCPLVSFERKINDDSKKKTHFKKHLFWQFSPDKFRPLSWYEPDCGGNYKGIKWFRSVKQNCPNNSFWGDYSHEESMDALESLEQEDSEEPSQKNKIRYSPSNRCSWNRFTAIRTTNPCGRRSTSYSKGEAPTVP